MDCPAADQTPGAAGLRTEAGTLLKVDLGRKEVRYKQKAPSIPRTGFLRQRASAAWQLPYQRPMALRPTLTGRLPLSALEKLDFQLVLL